jgi:isocitrate dehydrogenase
MATRLGVMQVTRRALHGSSGFLRKTAFTAPKVASKPLAKFQAESLSAVRWNSSASKNIDNSLSLAGPKVLAPPMVYIAGEEMTNYACNLIVEKWFIPYFDTSKWKHYDLSCKARDASNDQVLKDAVKAGKEIGAIFKEPTITPTAVQVKELGLSKPFGSPNGAMRRGWNGITISRDTIHIEGIELGKCI